MAYLSVAESGKGSSGTTPVAPVDLGIARGPIAQAADVKAPVFVERTTPVVGPTVEAAGLLKSPLAYAPQEASTVPLPTAAEVAEVDVGKILRESTLAAPVVESPVRESVTPPAAQRTVEMPELTPALRLLEERFTPRIERDLRAPGPEDAVSRMPVFSKVGLPPDQPGAPTLADTEAALKKDQFTPRIERDLRAPSAEDAKARGPVFERVGTPIGNPIGDRLGQLSRSFREWADSPSGIAFTSGLRDGATSVVDTVRSELGMVADTARPSLQLIGSSYKKAGYTGALLSASLAPAVIAGNAVRRAALATGISGEQVSKALVGEPVTDTVSHWLGQTEAVMNEAKATGSAAVVPTAPEARAPVAVKPEPATAAPSPDVASKYTKSIEGMKPSEVVALHQANWVYDASTKQYTLPKDRWDIADRDPAEIASALQSGKSKLSADGKNLVPVETAAGTSPAATPDLSEAVLSIPGADLSTSEGQQLFVMEARAKYPGVDFGPSLAKYNLAATLTNKAAAKSALDAVSSVEALGASAGLSGRSLDAVRSSLAFKVQELQLRAKSVKTQDDLDNLLLNIGLARSSIQGELQSKVDNAWEKGFLSDYNPITDKHRPNPGNILIALGTGASLLNDLYLKPKREEDQWERQMQLAMKSEEFQKEMLSMQLGSQEAVATTYAQASKKSGPSGGYVPNF